MEEWDVTTTLDGRWTNLSVLDYSLNDSEFTERISEFNSSINTTGPHSDHTLIYVACFLILCCTVSLVVNVVILSSVCFMRVRVNNTLYISLSLAAADTFSLFFLGLVLFIFTIFPRIWFNVNAPCLFLLIEGLRMGAIMTNLFHLAALALIHYLGILLPLKMITRRKIQYLIVILWTVPSSLILLDLFVLEADEVNQCNFQFLVKTRFRTRFCVPFFTTLVLMMFIYVHIYHLVCLHQTQRLDWGHRHSNTQVTKKAIVTTIMILGSTILGWLPPFIVFFIFCEDCILSDTWATIKNNTTARIAFMSVNQFLLITKPATNFYIYAFRMKEIRNALRKMKWRVLTFLRHPNSSSSRLEMMDVSFTRARSMRTSTCRRETLSLRISPSLETSVNGVSPKSVHLRRGRSSRLSRYNPSNTSV